jgi:predicted dehydrogenase
MTDPKGTNNPSRRDFLKTSAAVGGAVASQLGALPLVHAAGSDLIKIGLIGCGGRGTGAAENAAEGSSNVTLYAMADLFPDHLTTARDRLRDNEKLRGKFDVTDERSFAGFEAYQRLLNCGVDMVILATPPGFRPQHIAAAVKAGKHIFTEKPVAVDGPGIRKVLAAYEEAKTKNLGIVAGTQRRHQAGYIECMKRIHNGEIGEIRTARCYWNQGGLWVKKRESNWSDMEWQIRNWLYFVWLSGDHICEQHVHNLDVVNWALQSHPVAAVGMGGRQVRTGPEYGHIFDHFAIDYEYPNNVHVMSMCRQIEGCQNNVSESVVGSKGRWDSHNYAFHGASTFRFRDHEVNPYVQEHTDLVRSIRDGKPLNELRTVAESTLTAIMGRMSAYTGKAVTWDQALDSKLNTFPDKLVFGPLPVPPVATPGETELL